jgi:phosphoenolpyruvate carboxylase
VFAWTQVRLMLPAWLGSEAALREPADGVLIAQMTRDWPFFRMQMDMLEMVLAKTDERLFAYYTARLAPAAGAASIAEDLVARLREVRARLLELRHQQVLLESDSPLRQSLQVRNTYLDPLHVLQAELLARLRQEPDNRILRNAAEVTMAGIASGLRNTG